MLVIADPLSVAACLVSSLDTVGDVVRTRTWRMCGASDAFLVAAADSIVRKGTVR